MVEPQSPQSPPQELQEAAEKVEAEEEAEEEDLKVLTHRSGQGGLAGQRDGVAPQREEVGAAHVSSIAAAARTGIRRARWSQWDRWCRRGQ